MPQQTQPRGYRAEAWVNGRPVSIKDPIQAGSVNGAVGQAIRLIKGMKTAKTREMVGSSFSVKLTRIN